MGGGPLDLGWVRDLRHLAKTGNFTRAAALSHVSQPAFSRRIRAFEDWVGTTLVDRSRQPVRLTEAGRNMLEAGEQALARIEGERELVRESLALPDRYVVRFGAQHSIGWRFFPAWLQAFEAGFGPVLSRLRTDNLPDGIADLLAGELDFLMAYTSAAVPVIAPAAGLESVRVGRDLLVPVCRPDGDGRPMFALEPDEETEVPWLRFGAEAPIGRHLEPLFADPALRRRLRPVYGNALSGALRIEARRGTGVAWLPLSLVAPDIEAGLLVRTGPPALEVPLDIRLHRLRGRGNRLTREIWSWLAVREEIGIGPASGGPGTGR